MKPTIRRLAELGADERDRLTHRSLDRTSVAADR